MKIEIELEDSVSVHKYEGHAIFDGIDTYGMYYVEVRTNEREALKTVFKVPYHRLRLIRYD